MANIAISNSNVFLQLNYGTIQILLFFKVKFGKEYFSLNNHK